MEANEELTSQLDNRDWFCGVGSDNVGRLVVYVNKMNTETMTVVPDRVQGKQVLVHFITSHTACREDWVKDATRVPFSKPTLELVNVVDELDEDDLELDLDDLVFELDRLEKIYGSFTLEQVFFEVHDKQNAVTNLSDRYPELSVALNKLYDEYGFDVLYGEL